MRVMYEAYVPSYAISYDCLGDQPGRSSYKYGWELAVYFGFYVLPFINDLFTDEEFLPFFLRKFGLLGPINRQLQKIPQRLLSMEEDESCPPTPRPMLHDFYEMIAAAQVRDAVLPGGPHARKKRSERWSGSSTA